MAANCGFQISLDVRGWPVLVIGGDEEAAEKSPAALGCRRQGDADQSHDERGAPQAGGLGQDHPPRPSFPGQRPGERDFSVEHEAG